MERSRVGSSSESTLTGGDTDGGDARAGEGRNAERLFTAAERDRTDSISPIDQAEGSRGTEEEEPPTETDVKEKENLK